MTFSGARLKQLRIYKGQSVQHVANEVDVFKAHIWKLEKGDKRNPSVKLLRRLAQYFEVSIAYLVGEDPDASEENEKFIPMFHELKSLDVRTRTRAGQLARQHKVACACEVILCDGTSPIVAIPIACASP